MNTLIIFGAQYLYLVIVFATLFYVYRQPRERRRKILLCAVITLPVTYVVAKIASQFYYDPRPFVVENFTPMIAHINDNGFPSDHTLLSSAVAMTVFFFHRKLGLLLLGIAFLVGASRVFAGIHHFIDIFGSMAIAALVASIIFLYVFPRVEEKFLSNK